MTETSNLILSQKPSDIPNEVNEDALRAEYLAYAKEHGIEINESEDI